jgi:hypothetical protein
MGKMLGPSLPCRERKEALHTKSKAHDTAGSSGSHKIGKVKIQLNR